MYSFTFIVSGILLNIMCSDDIKNVKREKLGNRSKRVQNSFINHKVKITDTINQPTEESFKTVFTENLSEKKQ